MENAYFAGGCFWCIAAAFANLKGVQKVVDGYAGGNKTNPTYLEVKSQTTFHRETICVTFDEEQISYEKLLDVFFDNVDPFDPDGQFVDRGFSYTLALFYLNQAQQTACQQKIAQVEQLHGKKVCVTLLPYKNFYLAEEEHQNFAEKNQEAFAEEYVSSGREQFFKQRR